MTITREEPAGKRSRISINELIDPPAEQEKSIVLLRLPQVLMKTPMQEWEGAIPQEWIRAISDNTDLVFVLRTLSDYYRKPFLDLYIPTYLWRFVFSKDNENISRFSFLSLIPKFQWPAFINSSLHLAIQNIKALLQLADRPSCDINDCNYKQDFLRLINKDNLCRLINTANDLYDLLQSFSDVIQPEIIEKIGADKIRSLVNTKRDLIWLMHLTKFDICLDLVGREKVRELLKPERELSQLLAEVPQPLHLRVIEWMDAELVNQLIPDSAQLKKLLANIPETLHIKVFTHIARMALTKSVTSLRRFQDDRMLYVSLITVAMEQLRPQAVNNSNFYSNHDIMLHQSINILMTSLKKTTCTSILEIDKQMEKIKGPLVEIYNELIRPCLSQLSATRANDLRRPVN